MLVLVRTYHHASTCVRIPTYLPVSRPVPNRLLERLGEGAVSALFDEFVWPDAGGGEGCEAAGDTRAAVHGCSAEGDTTASGTADGGTTAGGTADGGAAGGYGAGGNSASRSAAQLPALRNLLVHGRLQLEEVRPEAVALPTPEH